MAGITFRVYFLLLLSALPLLTWVMSTAVWKKADQREASLKLKRQTGPQSSGGQECSSGSYLCPASVNFGEWWPGPAPVEARSPRTFSAHVFMVLQDVR